MGARGPKQKLAQLKKLEGNPGKRRIDEAVVQASGGAVCPEHLGDGARECFEAIVGSMPEDVYATCDSYAIATFATAWGWHRKATIALEDPETDPIVKGSQGQDQPNPWFKILKMMSDIMRTWGDRLGLDPKARANLHVPEPGAPASKFEGLVAIKGGRTAS